MVSIQVKNSTINGSIRCPSSKSYSHRAVAIASLAEGTSVISNALLARDTLATISLCKALGAEISHEGDRLYISGRTSFDAPDNILNAENSGTTIRIMAVMCSLVKEGFTVLTGDESLRKRPMQPIIDALSQIGVRCFSTRMNGMAPLVVRGGGIKGGVSVIDGTVSSQFISGILISGIYANSPITLKIKGELVSKPYIESTIASMKRFGVSIEYEKNLLQYHINNSRYYGTKFEVPSDFSTAALVLAAGIIAGGKLTVRGLDFKLPQADSRVIEIIKDMGGWIRVDRQRGEVTVQGTDRLDGGDFCLNDAPDLLPVVSILALKARSAVRISGVAHARLKETDRIANIASELSKFGATVKEFKDGLLIKAPKSCKGASVEAFNDHRLFMAFTIAAMLTPRSVVAGAESVDVSYPNFVDDMKKLGALLENMPDRE
jgi:3-phosphoshikimate 1-carboxyvinyltransferase